MSLYSRAHYNENISDLYYAWHRLKVAFNTAQVLADVTSHEA